MQWVKKEADYRVPIKSWCGEIEAEAMGQAVDLARHPVIFHHVALMPDCHVGYGMPIGGVITSHEAVIPNAVGVDIGCGMGAVQISLSVSVVDRSQLRMIVTAVKRNVPCGEGHAHQQPQEWEVLDVYMDGCHQRGWYSRHVRELAFSSQLCGAGESFWRKRVGAPQRGHRRP